ncbi:PREDICTED: glutamate receptor ionotropic, kainate 2-like isoform X2 [Nicrophorus vespilloides]|uniref:Glutamate receptor ionotropic, kainate 2-like isoform X2 n=1 Tax=Nicrophorus vespilloides TaxID=110193 RepID=A0ABM1MCC6_NICVS|nr:PREDICTED: glutamate receptor ionotropic, kainate 2-like isoform X2 [Nicrophorus vespilloides]
MTLLHRLYLIFSTVAVISNNPVHTIKIVKIGALFDNEYSEAEIAFRFAVNRFNMFNKDYTLKPEVRYVPETDGFKTGQIVCEMVESGLSAIFGPVSSKTNDIVQSIAETLEIPQFQTFWNHKLQKSATSTESTAFNLFPDPKLYSMALATLLKEMRWKSYTIVYESDEGLVRLQDILKLHRSDDVPVRVRKLTPGNDHRTLLKEIKASSELQIILDCEAGHILDILQQAQEVNLMDEYYSYILTSLDAHTLDFHSVRTTQANITTLRLIDPNTKYIRNAVRDWEQGYKRGSHLRPEKVLTRTALLYDAVNFFSTVYKELDATESIHASPLSCSNPLPSQHGIRLSSYLKLSLLHNGTLAIPLSGPIVLDSSGRRKSFDLQIVELSGDGVRKTGTWNSDRPHLINFTFTQQERQLEIVQQLSQKVFRVTSRLGAPYVMWRQPKTGKRFHGNDRFEGHSMDLIAGIAEILNFTYKFELVPDNNYGSYNPKTNEWNGLIRHLLDRKADLALCDLTITYERRRAVDFTMPFMTLGITILYSKAVKPPPELFSFMQPLSFDIWLYMATAYLGISIIIFVTARLAPGDWENPHPCNENPEELENIWDIKNCLWLTLGSLMAQGCDILPKGISTRMVAGMWWFFSLIMCASYTANLAAFLTMERMGPTIENAEDLAKQTKIKYGSVLGGATGSFFRDSNFSTYQRMWTQMEASEPSVFEKTNKEGVKRVKTSKRLYAFLMESSSIEYEMERDCELMQVGGWLDSKGYGIAMPIPPTARPSAEPSLRCRRMGSCTNSRRNGGEKCTVEENARL